MREVFAGRLTRRTSLLIVSEYLLILGSVALASSLRGVVELTAPSEVLEGILWKGSIVAAVLQVSLHYCDLYDLRTLSDHNAVAVKLLRAIGAASLTLAFLYYWIPTMIIGRGVFMLSSVIIVALIASWRVAFDWFSLRLKPSERLLIVGTNPAAITLARELFERRQELGVDLVGFIDPDPNRVGAPVINPGVIGAVADIPSLVHDRAVDRVVVSLSDARGKLSMEELLRMKLHDGVRFAHLASVYEEYTGKIAVENLRPSWMIFSDGFVHRRALMAAKRAVDVAASAIALIALSPVIVLVALAIKVLSPGPVFYHQQRVGKDGRVFRIHKFRSMRPNAEAGTGAIWSRQGDPRVTPVGRLLRRARLDELPQLWNVLRGDMSLVGPRPERPEFVQDLTERIPYFGQRHAVRPGITGWAQVGYQYCSTVESSLEKLQYDLFYIKHLSIALDLFILLETVKTVLVRRGS